jgi:hypothetical protein
MAQIGQVEYGEPHIIPNVPIGAPGGAGTIAAGEIAGVPNYTAPNFYGVCIHTYADGDEGALGVNEHYRVRKETGTGTAILQYDKLTFIPGTVADNNYVASKAGTGDEIHAIALEDADDDAESVLIHGPLWPFPFSTV